MTEISQQTSPVPTPPVPAVQQQSQPNPNPPDVAQNTEAQGQTQSIPYDRFKQVNDAKKVAEDKLKQYEDAERKRTEAEALKKGDFEKIISDLKPKAERATALEEALKGYLEAELNDVPASMRDLIPQGDVTTQIAWIKQAKAKGLFNRIPAPNTDAGVTGDNKQALKLSDQEQMMAKKLGLTSEQYAKNKRT